MADVNIIPEPYIPSGQALISSMANSIEDAAARVGVNALAVAGAIALEQNNAYENSLRYTGGSFVALAELVNTGNESDPSQAILSFYQAANSSGINSPTTTEKIGNIVFFDMGPARFRLQNAVRIALDYSTDPVLAAYKDNYYQLAVALYNNSDPNLTATLVAYMLKEGEQFYQSHMGPADDPQNGAGAWNALDPSQQNGDVT
jgi:hypothetical protein